MECMSEKNVTTIAFLLVFFGEAIYREYLSGSNKGKQSISSEVS